jgi:hypothetical protein
LANLFVHFEPVGHSLRHNAKTDAGEDVHAKYRDALSRGVSGHENDQDGLPSYIIAGTPEETHWRKAHPSGQVSNSREYALSPEGGPNDTVFLFFLFLEIKKQVVHHRFHSCARGSSGW